MLLLGRKVLPVPPIGTRLLTIAHIKSDAPTKRRTLPGDQRTTVASQRQYEEWYPRSRTAVVA